MPKDARLLSVQVQRGEPQLWAVVDPKAEKEMRRFLLRGTGHPVDEADTNLAYIGSFQMAEETLIFHLFELLE